MKFRDHWDEWGWLIVLAIIVFAIGVVLLGRDTFCSDKDTNCFREWVSALGGWAAVVAAVPTIVYLSKQVSSAAQHQRVNFELDVRSKLSLARAGKQNSIEARSNIEFLEADLAEAADRAETLTICRTMCQLSIEWLERPIFSEFEVQIGLPDELAVKTLTQLLVSQLRDMSRPQNVGFIEEPDEVFSKKVALWRSTMKLVKDYLRSLSEAADTFISDMADLKSQIT